MATAELQTETQLEGQLFAAVDLGSNSFHMLVARYDHGKLQVIDRIKSMVRLGGGLSSDGQLDAAVRDRALNCLAQFGQRLRQVADENIVAVGTNAMRQVRDGARFLGQAEQALEHSIQIIGGEEEARLIYLGVAHGIAERGNQRLVIDIGGGSTEFVVGRDFTSLKLESLFFGCVSITQRFFGDGVITAQRWEQATIAVAQELQRIAVDYKATGWQEVLGSSGTMKSTRQVCIEAGYSERGITPSAMTQLKADLIRRGHSDQLLLPGLTDRRRPVFVGGAAVIDACMKELALEQIIVTDYALREGLLYNLLGQILSEDPRDGTITGLLTKYHVDDKQAERVRRVALDLYDQIADEGQLPAVARSLLARSALLHELGLTISHHGYHRHGAYLIDSSDLPGFNRLEQQIIATLIGNHRHSASVEQLDQVLVRLRPMVRSLLVLLRIAVLICRSRSEAPLPQVSLQANDRGWTLRFPQDWLADHPLTRADLNDEIKMLKQLNIELSVSA